MPLLTYARYQQLGGELAEADLAPLEMRASKVVDALTHAARAGNRPRARRWSAPCSPSSPPCTRRREKKGAR